MIEFLKTLLKKVNFKSDDKELNKYNKLIYSIIILCTIVFIGLLIFFAIQQFPSFIEAVRYHWNDSKSIFKDITIK